MTTSGSVAAVEAERPTCKTCSFRPSGTKCRRFPPLAAVGAAALWPSTKDDDWCGEHPELSIEVTGAPLAVTVDEITPADDQQGRQAIRPAARQRRGKKR